MSAARKVMGPALDFIHERRKRELQSVSENGQNRGKNRADCALKVLLTKVLLTKLSVPYRGRLNSL